MPGKTQKSPARKPLAKRLQGSAILLSIIAFLLGLGWIFIAGLAVMLTPIGSYDEYLRSRNLPPREALSVADGRVVSLGEYSSRRRQYLKPKIEYIVTGRAYHAETIMAYTPELFPYTQFQAAAVLYLPNEPEKGWQKWEYERLIGDYEDAVAGPLIFKIKTIYNYTALGIFALSAILLAVNLFIPLLRYFVRSR